MLFILNNLKGWSISFGNVKFKMHLKQGEMLSRPPVLSLEFRKEIWVEYRKLAILNVKTVFKP